MAKLKNRHKHKGFRFSVTHNPSANRADLCLPSVCNKHALLLVNVGGDEDGTVQRALSIDSLNPLADAHDTLLVTELLRVVKLAEGRRAHIVDGGTNDQIGVLEHRLLRSHDAIH